MSKNALESYITEKAVVRGSSLHGKGVFAVAPIRRHELVAVWNGMPVTTAEMYTLPAEVQDLLGQVWFDLYLGPRSVEEIEAVDLMNHSCDPNCGVVGCTTVVARRDIAPGEELTFDYGTFSHENWQMDCRCGAATCRGLVTGADWRNQDFRRQHAGYLSHFIELLVAREGDTPALSPVLANA